MGNLLQAACEHNRSADGAVALSWLDKPEAFGVAIQFAAHPSTQPAWQAAADNLDAYFEAYQDHQEVGLALSLMVSREFLEVHTGKLIITFIASEAQVTFQVWLPREQTATLEPASASAVAL